MLVEVCHVVVFFFKQKTAYEMRISDWSSDVCSSDLSAPEPGAHCLAESLFRGEALGIGSRDAEGTATCLGDLDFSEDALLEALTETLERIGDPFDAAQVRSQSHDHRAASIRSRIRRTAVSSPVNTASPIRECPILSSAICGIAATGCTFS